MPYAFLCAGLWGGILMLLFYVMIELATLVAIIDRSTLFSHPLASTTSCHLT